MATVPLSKKTPDPRYVTYPKSNEPPLGNGEWFVLDHGDGLPDKADTKVLARCSDPTAADRIVKLLNEAADENTFLGIKGR